MAQKRDRSDWYSGSFRSAGSDLHESHKGMRVTMLVICVLVLIAGSSFLFRDNAASDSVPDPGFRLPGSPSVTQRPETTPSPDGSGSFGGSDGFGGFDRYDDFRDFFNEYYGGYGAGETYPDSKLPKVAAEDGASLELQSAAGKRELSLQELYQTCIDSVVGIRANQSRLSYSWGTGVIFRTDGYIITNQHIISGSDSVQVLLSDGAMVDAVLIGEDRFTDIAVLRIEAEGLTAAAFGDSNELSVGDRVVAIGDPLGDELSGTMTDGIISAINRNITVSGRRMTLLQTNAALNEGNSGGPLINMYGQVIGITNMKMVNYTSDVTIEGIGFAIPSSVVKSVADQLLSEGAVAPKPGIGISVGVIPEEAAEQYSFPAGLYIYEISEGSDARAKGLQTGDILTHVNGIPVVTADDVLAIRDASSVGDSLTLTIYRDGKSFDVEVVLKDITILY